MEFLLNFITVSLLIHTSNGYRSQPVAQKQPVEGCSCAVVTASYGYQIIPDLLSQPPCYYTNVLYDTLNIFLGHEVYYEETLAEPTATWPANPEDYYLFLIFDVDIPARSNATGYRYLNYLVVNIQGNNLETGVTVFEFAVSIPEYQVGYHRVAMLVYRQPAKLCTIPPIVSADSVEGRDGFSLPEFEELYNLEEPYAINFFTIRF